MVRPNTAGSGPREGVSPEIVDRCRKGDQEAWTLLVDATYRDVYTLCLRILGNPEDAADATQDAFAKAWRGLAGFRGDAAFTTWLYRVASNAAISKHRSRTRRRRHETATDDEGLGRIAASGSLEATADARLDVERVARALDQLPEHYRLAVLLRDVHGASIEEIARHMKITTTTAKVRVHRGRRRLRELVYPEGAQEETS